LKEEDLIFLISQPRSGSTYLQAILSNNSSVNTASESWILLNYMNQIKPGLVVSTVRNSLAVDAFDEYCAKFPEYDFNHKLKEFLLSHYIPLKKGYHYVLDKTPRYWEIMDEIMELFPKSKIIVLKRNPAEVIKSIINTWEIPNINGLEEFSRDILLAPKRLHKFIQNHKDNTQVLTLCYEDLVNDKPGEIKKVYNWLAIKFNEDSLDIASNTKYKGKYGDPYQNADASYTDVKTNRKNVYEENEEFDFFLKGYLHYLGRDFLMAYGYNYENSMLVKNKVFDNFLNNNPVFNTMESILNAYKKRIKNLEASKRIRFKQIIKKLF